MRNHPRLVGGAVGVLGALLLGVGIVYLTVACQDLPGILGPHPGDTSPRTFLGVVGVVLGLTTLAVAVGAGRRRPPSAPVQS